MKAVRNISYVEKLLNHLKERLGVDDFCAEKLLDLVIDGEADYLIWLYGYDKLKWTGVDEWSLLERLKRPFVFGFFVKAVLKSDLDELVKRKVALESWDSMDPAEEEGVPAYLFRTLNYLLASEGFNQALVLQLIDLCTRPLFYAQVTIIGDESEDIEELFNHVVSRVASPDTLKLAFLAAVLSLRNLSPNFKLKIYDRFLGDEGISQSTREELCFNAAQGVIEEYLKDWLKPYRLWEAGEREGWYHVPAYLPSLPRRSVLWLAGVSEERKKLVERYFKERVEGYDEPYQVLGALDVCRRYSRELGEDYAVTILRRALSSNRLEIRRTAERYLKELGKPYLGWLD